jgi:hypothetical protein
MFPQYARSSDVPTVGLGVRQVTCTDVPNGGSGHMQSKEISTFFHIPDALHHFES